MNTKEKNNVLRSLASLLKKNGKAILEANQEDITACVDIEESLLDRLKINQTKIFGMIASVEKTIELEDPEGKILNAHRHENGLKIENKSVAFGKILIIYESRPDVTIEASVLAFKAGNKVVLKGGKESIRSNQALVDLWHLALDENGVDKNFIIYLNTDRTETQRLIKENSHQVDLIIPRGGEGLINFVKRNTDIPIIVSGRGNNFAYIDKGSNFDMATEIILNGKSRISVCNALDKVLFHKDIPNLKEKIALLIDALKRHQIEILADHGIHDLNNQVTLITDKSIYAEEFLAAKIHLSLVSGINEAIHLSNTYSGGHSATIITMNNSTAEKFQKEVDCAAVYHNASTRFTDGGQFGFGAEIAISTQKLHARGPIGLNQLVTNKWFISGNGQIR